MTRSLAAHLPAAPGVYRFRDGRGGVLYVGRAVELRRRVASYFSDLRDRQHLTPMVRRIARVGGSLIGILAILFILIDVAGVIRL